MLQIGGRQSRGHGGGEIAYRRVGRGFMVGRAEMLHSRDDRDDRDVVIVMS